MPDFPSGAPALDFWQLLSLINEQYPQLLPILSQPGVFKVVADAAQNNWPIDRLQAALQNTPYFKETPKSRRQWDALRLTDPATANQKVAQYTHWVNDAMHQTGVNLASAEGWGLFTSPYFQFLNKAISEGWDQQEIKYQMTIAGPGGGGGEEATQAARVKKLADDYGLPISDFAANMYGKSLTAGMIDMQAVTGDFVGKSKSLYPGISEMLDRGFTVRQIADPYLQIAQQELGVDPTTIQLTDPKWNRAINNVTPDGQRASMSLSDWTSTIRSDNRYGYDQTDQAQKKAMITDPNAADPHEGLSAFILEMDRKGVKTGDIHGKLGMRAGSTGWISMQDVHIPAANLLGKEGEGFKIAMSCLDNGRYTVAAGATGLIRASLDASVKYSHDRKAFNREIGQFQLMQQKIAYMVQQYEAARLLYLRAGWMKNQGQRNTKETSLAKWYATDASFDAANEAIQVHGAYGYSDEYDVERYLRNSRGAIIYEGTSEIHQLMQAGYALGYRDDAELRCELPAYEPEFWQN